MNLAHIRSAVWKYFIHKQKTTDWRRQKQNLPQFIACCKIQFVCQKISNHNQDFQTKTSVMTGFQITHFLSDKETPIFINTRHIEPHMDGSIIFTRLCQCAPASHSCFLGPTPVHIPNGISMVQSFLHSSWKSAPFPSKLLLHRGIWTPSTQVHNQMAS